MVDSSGRLNEGKFQKVHCRFVYILMWYCLYCKCPTRFSGYNGADVFLLLYAIQTLRDVLHYV